MKRPTHEDVTVTMACPSCAHQVAKQLAWFRTHNYYGCRACRTPVEVHADYKRKAAALQSLINSLDAAFGEFFDDD